MGRSSNLKSCQLLSAGPQVIYPVGLNGCATSWLPLNLPELLHSSSNITTDEQPHVCRIDIALPTPEESECTTLLLGGVHATPVDNYT